jgi:hypothetical protein
MKPPFEAAKPGDSKGPLDPWDRLVGPFYDELSVAKFLGVSSAALSRQVTDGAVLRTVTRDGTNLYPQFQFSPTGELLPRLSDILAILRQAGADDWGHAQWLNTTVDRYDGRSAATMLREGNAERVIADAQQDARRWAQ